MALRTSLAKLYLKQNSVHLAQHFELYAQSHVLQAFPLKFTLFFLEFSEHLKSIHEPSSTATVARFAMLKSTDSFHPMVYYCLKL